MHSRIEERTLREIVAGPPQKNSTLAIGAPKKDLLLQKAPQDERPTKHLKTTKTEKHSALAVGFNY